MLEQEAIFQKEKKFFFRQDGQILYFSQILPLLTFFFPQLVTKLLEKEAEGN